MIFAVPKLMPLICGCAAGVICPAGMNTVVGAIVTMVGSEVASVTVVPLAGAAAGNPTWNAVDFPSPTVAALGTRMVPAVTTVTEALVSATFGNALA